MANVVRLSWIGAGSHRAGNDQFFIGDGKNMSHQGDD